MTSTKEDKIYQRLFEINGYDELIKATEELVELSQQICKAYLTLRSGRLPNRKAIIDELADVEIVIPQVKKLLNIEEADVKSRKNIKFIELAKELGEYGE